MEVLASVSGWYMRYIGQFAMCTALSPSLGSKALFGASPFLTSLL
jgi:hypothetical protein